MKRLLLVIFTLVATRAFCHEDILPRPPRKDGASELVRLVRDTRVGGAYHYKNLVVYPLFSSGLAVRGYWTLDEALAKGVLRISEKGEGSVPELLVENRSDDPIFLLSGEIVTGGKQNRVISQDVLLPPRSGLISLGVFCVEQGRWARQTHYFGAEKELAHGKLRQQLSADAVSQSAVWSEVARKSTAVAGAMENRTQYLGRIYEDREVKEGIEAYTRAIVLPATANGFAVVIGGRVVGAEIFGNCATFAKLRVKLLRSYAVDALEYPAHGKTVVGAEVVEQFLRRVENARVFPKETVGIGRLFGFEGGGAYGSSLVWPEQNGAHGVVHASLFADSRAGERPPIVPLPMPRPLPYDRD